MKTQHKNKLKDWADDFAVIMNGQTFSSNEQFTEELKRQAIMYMEEAYLLGGFRR